MKKKSKQVNELISFHARVVEVEGYKSLVEGKVLYHAVLDSLPGQPQRQAQFFGLSENVFKAGDLHVVAFSRPIVGASKRAVKMKITPSLIEMTQMAGSKPN